MSRQYKSRASRTESAIGKVAGPFVILVAVSAGVIAFVAPSVPPLFVAGTESFLITIGGIGYLLLRLGRRGMLYARVSELRSGERKLAAFLAIPTFVSAGLDAISTVNLNLLLPIEVGVSATGILVISIGIRRQSGK